MTKILSATDYPTLNLVYPSMMKLIKKVSPPPNCNDDYYAEILFGPLEEPAGIYYIHITISHSIDYVHITQIIIFC